MPVFVPLFHLLELHKSIHTELQRITLATQPAGSNAAAVMAAAAAAGILPLQQQQQRGGNTKDAFLPPLEKNMAQSELAMAFRTMKAMEVGCKKIKYLFKACQPHDVTYKKLMTWLNVRSEKADYKQLTEEGRVDEFLDLQLKETDKPKAMNETEQTLNNVKQFDSERSQDYF